jgi:hypothetical protein
VAAEEGGGSREQRREGRKGREQRREGGGSKSRVVAAAPLALSLSSLFIGGGWLGLRGGCSWTS